ncbi:hypothetical protein PENANT_c025G02075 [Penicillium antarcticum]|uniref:PAS domain-containing protein n=1 Tax=Penicillium antarcticum TaxID=416450 RepID=A0A1V6PXU0_9EURO|nr:uncharacterized protein N7508_000330 [Penicillium antarcticum]KAJ5320047.1 hypothetical protein N7508_000330 [Penicillium antarcticum]OQD81763.1 hypothetical protein PENANT_c025G02075 [Penicillium antarcticum]
MDTTFITIHGRSSRSRSIDPSLYLSRDASIRYASGSIEVVLGYQPHEVLDRSCWEYFHPQELPFARSIHGRGVRLDKAAVLNYCSIRHKNGSWVGCECVFTVVYDVLIASTTVYGRGHGSQKRAADAPIVRQLFNSSPNDPRYHMLTWISNKFSQRLAEPLHEPRAAMFVNRFTRTATIMYATSGVSEILGISPHALISQSFYYCIQEECLGDAIRCLEGAKRNDSIAYLRFWFRNPLQDVHGSGRGLDAVTVLSPIELEAVVSCTSDGLVVILRRARAPIPTAPTVPAVPEPAPVYTNGIFAAPWAPEPVFSYGTPSYTPSHPAILQPSRPDVAGTLCRDPAPGSTVHGIPLPEQTSTMCRDGMETSSGSASDSVYGSVSEQEKSGGPGESGPHSYRLMDTIRDVAVFAWGIVGINRGLEQYKYGTPTGNSRPEDEMDLDESC